MTRNIFVILIALSILSCGAPKKKEDTQTESSAEENGTKNNEEVLTAIKQEPKVKDVVITDANVLYAAVEDDGTPRNGYAEYLCQVLAEHKTSVKWVKVVKYGSMNDAKADNAYGILLGDCHCK
jgi:hypothetical protein